MERIEKLKRAIEGEREIGPEMVMISPTDKCNLNCKTCWRRDKQQDEFEVGLSLEKVKEVLDDCERLDVKKIDFTGGGEPFLRKEIFDMIKEAKNRGFEVGFTTNGCFMDRSKVSKLVDLRMDEVLLSLDGKEDTNDFLRDDGVYEKVIEAVELFNELGFDGTLGFSTVISSANYQELKDVAVLGQDLGLDYVNFIIMNRWESNKRFQLDKVEDKVLEALEEVKEFEERNEVDTNAGNILEHGIFQRGPPKFCFAPWDMAFINASGEMMACCTLASYYKNLLGNLENSSFYELWNSNKMESFREEMRGGDFHEKCEECLPDFIEKYDEIYRKLVKNYGFEG